MVTPERARELALSLPDASEAPHFDRTAFRVPKRIFATLGVGARDLNLRLDPELQAAVVEARPRAFAPVQGGWGRMGWTRCELDAVAEVDLERALREAHAGASLPPPKRAKKAAKKSAKKSAKKAAPAKSLSSATVLDPPPQRAAARYRSRACDLPGGAPSPPAGASATIGAC